MFCSECGKQIPDNTKFCNHCGAQQPALGGTESQPTPQPQPQPAPQSQKAERKKPNYLVIVAVFICAALIGRFVIAPSMVSNLEEDTNSGKQSSQNQSSADTGSAAYNKILADAYIVHASPVFGKEIASYVIKMSDGTIVCADLAGQDDVVKEMVETTYFPVSGLTDAQKKEKENTLKMQMVQLEALSCCSVSYTTSENYLKVTAKFRDLDKQENYSALYHLKINGSNAPMSMSETEKSYLSQGFVKK